MANKIFFRVSNLSALLTVTVASLLSPAAISQTASPSKANTPSAAASKQQEGVTFRRAETTPLTKEQITALAAQLVRASGPLSQIWPGYWPEDQAFIIHVEGRGALLVSPGDRPSGFVPMSADVLPPELEGRAFYHEGTMKDATRPFILDYPIGNGRTAVLVNASPTPEATASLILHEQFHAYQTNAFEDAGDFKGWGNQFVDPLAVKDRASFAATAQTEKRVLAAAVSAKTAKERKNLLQGYFALRREREATIPKTVRLVEQGFERREGTARYIDRQAHAILFGKGELGIEPLLLDELTKTEKSSPSFVGSSAPFATTWFRLRGYTTGAALSYLLSLYDSNWRSKIEQGAKLDELLESHVGRIGNSAALAEAARKRFGYQQSLKTLGPLIKEAEKKEIKSVDEFMELGAYAVDLQVENPRVDGKPRYESAFSAMNMALLSPSLTALPMAFVYSMSGPSLDLVVREKPVLMNRETSLSTTTALLKSAPRIEGRGELPPGEHRFDRLKVSGEGYELSLGVPSVVTVRPNSLHIRVQEPK